MFKRYDFRYIPQCGYSAVEELNFYVYGKPGRKGFVWRATVYGNLPRLDDINKSYDKYARNSERLKKVRTVKERPGPFPVGWGGRQVLVKLWERLAKLPFVDMGAIVTGNPFDVDDEPRHEELLTPEQVFDI
jgi:hypothetical protein